MKHLTPKELHYLSNKKYQIDKHIQLDSDILTDDILLKCVDLYRTRYNVPNATCIIILFHLVGVDVWIVWCNMQLRRKAFPTNVVRGLITEYMPESRINYVEQTIYMFDNKGDSTTAEGIIQMSEIEEAELLLGSI